ncbi:unnamed protein product [Pleuronectes platessa]|uniref:Methionine adenosyltransferase 2 subunit beta n=1 Tax=Pleuronectes platessa TaxID=8262 RepID=A0A9N7TZL8_PLEPL|nr:unnamed protein product [Pleuronectes platessa]
MAAPDLKVLVTGATGLLGRAVCREFESSSWFVIGTGYRRARPRLLRCDLTDEDAIRRLLHKYKPDVIVHCAAERRPDVVERHTDAAVNLNVNATSTLAKEAAACGAFFLYISSDYVFDGRSPPYGEDDVPNPLNLYGRTKAGGRERDTEALSRCGGAPGACSVRGGGRFPTDARDVAAVCRKLSERARQDPSLRGIFHFSSNEQMTKYEMGVAIAQAFQLPSNHLIPLLNLNVEPRPFTSAITDCLWPFTPDKRWRQTVFH